ncbi:MAG: LacI family transcriptional regulator [Anaerolineae bacterium]|nr:LacI family transcriptional regulator [Anaerolineae bacterium]
MATIKDVAKAAGVSTATVSYVLNGTKRIGEEVEQRVRQAAETLQYRPNAAAQNLRRNQTHIIGYELPIPLPGDMSLFMQRFTYDLTLAAEHHGYHLITFAPSDTAKPLDIYRQLILSSRIDGFVISNTNWHDERLKFLMEAEFPFVSFGRSDLELEFPFVDVDGYEGIRQVMEHLLELGHQKIAFIGWPEGSYSGDTRYNAYRHFVPEVPRVRRVENDIEQGYHAARSLLENPPTAIVCVSDVLAIGAMRYLTEAHYRVGVDIAVTGFDDTPLAQYITPPLTSVQQPIQQVVQNLITMLVSVMEDAPPPMERHLLLKPNLVVRQSTVP